MSLEDEMVNLRIVSKQMQRSSKKCEKNEKAALQKLKKVSHFVFWIATFIIKHQLKYIYCVVLNRLFNKEIMKELESTVKTQLERRTRP